MAQLGTKSVKHADSEFICTVWAGTSLAFVRNVHGACFIARSRLALRVCAFAGALLASTPAYAQLVSPTSNAVDIPTDVVPFVDDFLEDGTLRLETASGVYVDAETIGLGYSFGPSGSGTYSFEILPRTPLAPGTTYAIRARLKRPIPSGSLFQSTFTTGSGAANAPAPGEPVVTVQLSHTRAETGYSGYVLCLRAEGAPFVDVTATDSSGAVSSRFIREGQEHALHGVILHPDSCLEIRARNMAGVRSSPVRRCSVPFFPAEGWFPHCKDGRVLADGEWFADEGPPDAGDAGRPGASGERDAGADSEASPSRPRSRASDGASNSGTCAAASPAGTRAGLSLNAALAALAASVLRRVRLVRRDAPQSRTEL